MNIESIRTATAQPRTPEAASRAPTAPAQSRAPEAAKSQPQAQFDNAKGERQQSPSLEDAVKKLTDFVAPTNSEISFSIDEASGTRVVQILDTQSKEVIRQIPSEEAIQLAQALNKLQGLFVKDKA